MLQILVGKCSACWVKTDMTFWLVGLILALFGLTSFELYSLCKCEPLFLLGRQLTKQ